MNPHLYKTLGIDWPWLDLIGTDSSPEPRAVSERSEPPVKSPAPQRIEVSSPAMARDTVRDAAILRLDWEGLRASIDACQSCGLHQGRQKAVFGAGALTPAIMFIGEGPSPEDDQTGSPFMGATGQLLDRMVEALGLTRAEVFLTHVVKCHPPGQRTPHRAESEACSAYLERQIELVAPKVIVALGRLAALTLLKSEFNLSGLRGRIHHYGKTPLVVTYPPAYLLRNPAEKARAWQDLCLALDQVA